jgi:Fic family protein
VVADDILKPEVFAPAGAAQYVLEEVDAIIAKIDAQRPLSPELVARMESEILADRVHSSAVTEGNRLSRRETLVVLSTGLIEAGSRKDVTEVRNLARAITETEKAIARSEVITPLLLRQLQGILLEDIEHVGVGAFRSENVAISGATHQPPDFHDVPGLVQAVCQQLGESYDLCHPIQLATWAHWAMARIHPFRDGNGRLARLVQDYVLLRRRYVPAPLRSEDREGLYYEALDRADSGDGQALLEIVAKNTLRMADRYMSLISEEESKRNWISAITKAAMEKVKQSDHRRFLAIQRSFANLKAEFLDVCRQLDGQIPELRARFVDYGDIEFEKFQGIEHGRFAKKAWLWGVELAVHETRLRFVFWYGAHIQNAEDPQSQMPSRVVLLVSVQQDNYYVRLDEVQEDRISLRTVMPAESLYWRKRFDPVRDQNVWDKDLTAGDIARAFFQESLGKLGLL